MSTTRASDLTTLGLGFGHSMEIETFTAEQGALFLLHRAGLLALDVTINQARAEERQRAMELSEELGGLPLALDQAGAYIAKVQCTLESYQQVYQTHRRQLLEERRGKKEHPDPVATTWKLSFERVEATNAAAAELLRLCSFLAPDAIPEWMLVKGAEEVGSLLAPVVTDTYLLDQAVEALRAYSLLRRDAQIGMLLVHRLVQAVLRDAMTEEEETDWKQRVQLLLQEVCPDMSKVEQWPACEQWVPHALVSATWLEQASLQTERAALVCNEAGYYLLQRGWYKLAKPLLVRALEIREQELGAMHPWTATSLNNLALLYQTQGKYEEAEPLYERVLVIDREVYGADHPEVAMDMNNLAAFYQEQGKYTEAEPLYERALAIREQSLGPMHPDTSTNLNNLATLYQAQGKYTEAEPLYERALAIREQSLGDRHFDTTNSLNTTSAGWDKTVQVWNAQTNQHIYTYRGHSDTVRSIAWSPDSTRIASASRDLLVQVWEADTGRPISSYSGHPTDTLMCVAWSLNGTYIASSGWDKTVQIWEALTGNHIYTYSGHAEVVMEVAWSHDSKRIASASVDRTVQVWEALTGSHAFIYHGHTSRVYSVTWSPDGRYLASGQDRAVHVWQPG